MWSHESKLNHHNQVRRTDTASHPTQCRQQKEYNRGGGLSDSYTVNFHSTGRNTTEGPILLLSPSFFPLFFTWAEASFITHRKLAHWSIDFDCVLLSMAHEWCSWAFGVMEKLPKHLRTPSVGQMKSMVGGFKRYPTLHFQPFTTCISLKRKMRLQEGKKKPRETQKGKKTKS